MLLAYQPLPMCIPTMHSAVVCGVNGGEMFWSATRAVMTDMVDMFGGLAVKCLKNKPMNFRQPSAYSDIPVSISINRASPNPALVSCRKVAVKPQERVVCEHDFSIVIAGFKSSLGAVHESAVRQDAPNPHHGGHNEGTH